MPAALCFEDEVGCLPIDLGIELEELRLLVPQLTAEEVELLGQSSMISELPYSDFPQGIIGNTKDRQVAYYGFNYLGTMPLEDLETLACAFPELRSSVDHYRQSHAKL